MKIDSSIKTVGNNPANSGAARPGGGKVAPAGAGASGKEQVQLSPLSVQLQATQNSMAGSPVVDAAQVAEIRLAIAEGRFKVNADAVADQLIETARELLSSRGM